MIRRFGRQLRRPWCRLCLRGAGEVHRLIVSTVHGQMLDVGLLRQLRLRGSSAGRRRRGIRGRAFVLPQRRCWTLLGDLGLQEPRILIKTIETMNTRVGVDDWLRLLRLLRGDSARMVVLLARQRVGTARRCGVVMMMTRLNSGGVTVHYLWVPRPILSSHHLEAPKTLCSPFLCVSVY